MVTSGASRWYNYYLEGLNWLVRNVEIDGLYLDDVTYDRQILKRMRKIMERARPGCLIDLHSNTLFSHGPANQYMEFFPYVDRLWFGEGFNYDDPPDYWLTEVSGIPFGLMGEMLQDGGNKWRGMLYGMTARMPWRDDIGPLWRLWDEFGIAEARMIGYWEKDCPVRTDQPGVLATVYTRPGKTLVSRGQLGRRSGVVPPDDRLAGPRPGPGENNDHRAGGRELPGVAPLRPRRAHPPRARPRLAAVARPGAVRCADCRRVGRVERVPPFWSAAIHRRFRIGSGVGQNDSLYARSSNELLRKAAMNRRTPENPVGPYDQIATPSTSRRSLTSSSNASLSINQDDFAAAGQSTSYLAKTASIDAD